MTREFFDGQMARLLILRLPPESLDSHFGDLQTIEEDVFELAIGVALRERRFFPAPSELRVDCDKAARQIWSLTPTASTLGQQIDSCEECLDTGRRTLWCGPEDVRKKPWLTVRPCAKSTEHLPHEWVNDCPCADTNPVIRRKKQSTQRYSTPAARPEAR